MNKIQQSLFITVNDFEVNPKTGKIEIIKGSFYFQGKVYTIENKTIKGE